MLTYKPIQNNLPGTANQSPRESAEIEQLIGTTFELAQFINRLKNIFKCMRKVNFYHNKEKK